MPSRTDPAAATEGGVFIAPKTDVLYLLVAGDDAAESGRLREALLANRCACDFVQTAEDSVRAFTARDYDLVLFALHTTAEQLIGAIRALRDQERKFPEPRVPVFVLAGAPLIAHAAALRTAGADDVMARGTDFEQLYQIIERTVSLDRRTPPELIAREPLNYSVLLERCNEDAALAWQQIAEFRALTEGTLAELRAAEAAGDGAAARLSAERLRLAAIDLKSARVQRTAYLATKLDRIPRGQFAGRIAELIVDLAAEARDLITWIELRLGQVIIGRPPVGPMPAQSPLAQSENFLRRMERAGLTWPGFPGGGEGRTA